MSEVLFANGLPHVENFIARWQGKDGSEKANYQLFLTELCQLLAVEIPQPATAKNQNNAYVFERRVDMVDSKGKSTPGFIDLYKRDCFVLEAKSTKKKQGSGGLDMALERAYNQADGYIKNLPQYEKKPPFLIVTDVGHVLQLYSEFTCSGSTYTAFPDSHSYRIRLEDLRQPLIFERLKAIWLDPHSLDPSKKAALVTREIAKHLAELAKSLEQQYAAEAVASFLMRCLFSMFAEDVGLLPSDSFKSLLERLKDKPASCAPALQNLWKLMDTGGYDSGTMETIKRFNGGLFANATALALSKPQIELLLQAAQADWRFVEPAIFGTLLERALNPKERHKLGAHYTPRAYVERLVFPTVIEPLRQAWKDVQASAVLLAQQPISKGKKQTKLKEAVEVVREFHQNLCHLSILDPACGTGNFLYVTLEHLKKLEGEIFNFLADLGFTQGQLEMEGVSVNPQQFLGLEVNPRAAKIAEMVLWIGYLQWHFRTHGNVAPAEPILQDFHNIECRDAVLAWDSIEPVLDEAGQPVTRWDGVTMKVHPVTGKEVPDESARVGVVRYVGARKAVWPKADFIVGNPPFIGNKRMRTVLGDGYVDALRSTWVDVPDSADFVMYWWHQAAETVRTGQAKRFGFITTNSLRQTFNRKIIQHHLEADQPLSLLFAIPDHPWVDSADGAAVRIAMTTGVAGNSLGKLQQVLAETEVSLDEIQVVLSASTGKLFADLRIGANISAVTNLKANSGVSNRGVIPHGEGMTLSPQEAQIVGLGSIVGIDKHLKDYRNGKDIMQVPRNIKVIDLYPLKEHEVREKFPALYQWLVDRVKPERMQNKDKSLRENWWLHRRNNEDMRKSLKNLERYIATVQTAKHRAFVFLECTILPDDKLIAIGLEDAFYLGVLSSRLHVAWSLASGSRLGVGNDPVYNKSMCFDAFPFPDATEAQKAKIRDLTEQLDSHRKRQQAQYPDLTLTNMYNVLETLRTGEVFNDKEKHIHQQGLITILKELHDDLDRAVFDAYGWNDLAPRLVGKAGATTPLADKPDEQTQAEEDLLSRLVALNAERAAEEAQDTIRWLRPDFQAPHALPAPIGLVIEAEGKEIEVVSTPPNRNKLEWPKKISEQIQVVRQLLTQSSYTVATLEQQFKKKPKDLSDILTTLCNLGHVTQTADTYHLI